MLADLDSLERRRPAVEKKAKGQDKEAKATLAVIDTALKFVSAGRPARLALTEIPESEHRAFRQLQLLTAKPALYVCNVDEASSSTGNAYSRQVVERFSGAESEIVIISAKIEAELAHLDEGERALYLKELGLTEPGLNRLIAAGYRLLGLITYFTAGPKETRAWTITSGTTAPGAAGVIHSDFEKGFIRAETIAYRDFVALGGEAGAKEAGKMRLEGKDYTVHDGDVMHFRFAT
jgi:GTP-binding protein YchF